MYATFCVADMPDCVIVPKCKHPLPIKNNELTLLYPQCGKCAGALQRRFGLKVTKKSKKGEDIDAPTVRNYLALSEIEGFKTIFLREFECDVEEIGSECEEKRACEFHGGNKHDKVYHYPSKELEEGFKVRWPQDILPF